MIEMGKTYRTRDGREVRIYAENGEPDYPIHGAIKFDRGWVVNCWEESGSDGSREEWDLVHADPHGILPRHRELLASVYDERGCTGTARTIRDGTELGALQYDAQAALIALARLDRESGE